MTETRQDLGPLPADVQSITDALLRHAADAGGQLTSTEVRQVLEAAEIAPTQAKKLLRTLAEEGVLVLDESAAPATRSPAVVAATARTAASQATTVKVDSDAPDTDEAGEPRPAKAAARTKSSAKLAVVPEAGEETDAAAAKPAKKAPAKKAPAKKKPAKKGKKK